MPVDRSGDLLIASSPEGDSGPLILEALARGRPVLAARAGDLPEIVGGAGLTFVPGDAEDLARQIERVLAEPPPTVLHQRIAVVSLRYGTDFAGGAEASLRTIAEVLHRQRQAVEVFTTCTRSAAHWKNDLSAGTVRVAGVPVHRFPVDPYDRERHLESVRHLLGCRGPVPAAVEEDYLRHTVRSSGLIAALGRRIDQLDAVIVGPYLFGLTLEVATAFPDRTLVLPCFHDEPLARLRTWQTYERTAGLLFHSPEEQAFAQAELGLNHPNSVEVGVYLPSCDRQPAAAVRPVPGRFLVYCGRYSEEKGLPRLLEYARQYYERHPGRFRFVFLGEGAVTIPAEDWARDLGFVREERKRAVLAGADALVQLSRHESLSLVALEAWAAGVPVLADAGCEVLAGQIRRCGGGRTVRDFSDFARVLDDLWADPQGWRDRGERGREYVRSRYGSAEAYADRLLGAVAARQTPLCECMRQAGPKRAAAVESAWREGFAAVVEDLLHREPRAHREQVEVRPQQRSCTAAADIGELLLPVVVSNLGTHLAAAGGPGRFVLCARAFPDDQPVAPVGEAALPRDLLPGQRQPAVIPVRIPVVPGRYELRVWAERLDREGPSFIAGTAELVVSAAGAASRLCALELVQAHLASAERDRRLPQDYVDVTEGWFARLKRWIKRKLLNNFKRAYVDVLSGQQSEVNAQLLAANRYLADCCATLDHAVRVLQERLARLEEPRASDSPQRHKGHKEKTRK
jgi:glycosyltransferase involved in cell wall biosynthesis